MPLEITKEISEDDLKVVFEGDIPNHHPLPYFLSRFRDGYAFLARADGEPAGFLMYTIWWGNCPFIELIKVREKYQRQGTGIALLKAAAKEMKDKNFKTLISSTEATNPLGQNFHERWGLKKLNSLQLPHGEEYFYKIELESLINA